MLVAGLVVGISAAIYSNRDEIRELYAHREEIQDFINQKRLEWRLRRGPRRKQKGQSAAVAATNPTEAGPSTRDLDAKIKDADEYSMYEFSEHDVDDDGFKSEKTSVSEFPTVSSSTYYTSGHSYSISAQGEEEGISSSPPPPPPSSHASNSDFHDLRHRTVHMRPHQDYYDHGVERYGFRSVQQQRTRTNSFRSELSEESPSLSYGGSRRDSGSEFGWIGPTSSLGSSYSELATPSVTDSNTDDYQSLYLSDDDQHSSFRLQRVTH